MPSAPWLADFGSTRIIPLRLLPAEGRKMGAEVFPSCACAASPADLDDARRAATSLILVAALLCDPGAVVVAVSSNGAGPAPARAADDISRPEDLLGEDEVSMKESSAGDPGPASSREESPALPRLFRPVVTCLLELAGLAGRSGFREGLDGGEKEVREAADDDDGAAGD